MGCLFFLLSAFSAIMLIRHAHDAKIDMTYRPQAWDEGRTLYEDEF